MKPLGVTNSFPRVFVSETPSILGTFKKKRYNYSLLVSRFPNQDKINLHVTGHTELTLLHIFLVLHWNEHASALLLSYATHHTTACLCAHYYWKPKTLLQVSGFAV